MIHFLDDIQNIAALIGLLILGCLAMALVIAALCKGQRMNEADQ